MLNRDWQGWQSGKPRGFTPEAMPALVLFRWGRSRWVVSQTIQGRAARRVDGNDDAYRRGISQLAGRGAHTIPPTNSAVGKNIFCHRCHNKDRRSTQFCAFRNLCPVRLRVWRGERPSSPRQMMASRPDTTLYPDAFYLSANGLLSVTNEHEGCGN